ncbi:MAG TPA: tRNA uridine-5-carboxymethylaminomethyl(34) synthesis GTPase MnmE [Rhodothermales bacterium]|nr:tRNA uridine-5-carboxymethylaminomethyl(34) synthesis GTPase MnmE [Rhodothermales bacterium]
MTSSQDTIAAIATARGRAALAIVRVSGPDAVRIADGCLRGPDLATAASHTAHFAHAVSADGQEIDQVVATIFRAPRSSTGEDVVEITCHGGDFASSLVLRSLVAGGARLAEPGEFTQRAFLNGKLDLAQAESVADLIHASSSLAHRVSLSQLEGRYSDLLRELRTELLDLSALVELELDFTEEDVEFANRIHLEALLGRSEGLLGNLLNSYQIGAVIRDGVQVVIGGRPNAGKSTLLNALVGRERAIVSEVPGTTRDAIEAEVEIEGLLFRFIDTAGLRDTEDVIEAEGVRRAKHSIDTGDILLYLFDVAIGLDTGERAFLEELRGTQPELPILVIANKQDLAPDRDLSDKLSLPYFGISAEWAKGHPEELHPLVEVLVETVGHGLSEATNSPVVVNQRHRDHLARALKAVRSARQALDSGGYGDTLALDLRLALQELGAITGEITNEDVLDQIFSRFCIGK